jgi:Fe-S oxidoreductase
MDLCLSCKGCKSECPSNVDMAKLKAEFLQHYYDANGVPFRSRLIANFSASARLGSIAPGLYNFATGNALLGSIIKKLSGFHTRRSMPTLHGQTLRAWYRKHQSNRPAQAPSNTATGKSASPPATHKRSVYLFCDEFTNYNDTGIGIKAVRLLEALGYTVLIPEHGESGRTWLSKGLVRKAQQIAQKNIDVLSPLVSEDTPLLGIEPSAILCFRDEYPDLAADHQLEAAGRLAENSFMVDEFLAREAAAGRIDKNLFTKETRKILLHGHCQQKAVASVAPTAALLSLPENYSVDIIPSGCCGMAGSFGYEKEHYEISMQIGELVLFPAVRKASADTIIAAPGTSCRHQVKDGTGRHALHPVEILFDALAMK